MARQLVQSQLAACVNIIGSVRSVYSWKGEVCCDDECMIVAKTVDSRFGALKERILELHSYDCPEIVAVCINDGHEAYLRWISQETNISS